MRRDSEMLWLRRWNDSGFRLAHNAKRKGNYGEQNFIRNFDRLLPVPGSGRYLRILVIPIGSPGTVISPAASTAPPFTTPPIIQ